MSEQTRVPASPGSPVGEHQSVLELAHRRRNGLYLLPVLALAVAATALIGSLAGGGSRRAPVGGAAARAARAAARTKVATADVRPPTTRAVVHEGTTAAVGGARAAAGEVRDPQEAASHPAPASALHSAAASPAKAGEAVVAAGAPSDAEVKAELEQMEAAKRAAAQRQRLSFTPVPGGESIGGNSTIPIPPNVPEVVRRVIAGANEIADFPYVYGGGHASFIDNAYDCSGSVSYALAAGGLLGQPETSGELESWGAPGPGRYITVLANPGHTYMYVDGVLYDTAGRSAVYASRWQVQPTDNSGYVVRHWPGL